MRKIRETAVISSTSAGPIVSSPLCFPDHGRLLLLLLLRQITLDRGSRALTLGQPERGGDRHAVDARAPAEGQKRDRAAGILDYAVDQLDPRAAELDVRLAARAQDYPACNRRLPTGTCVSCGGVMAFFLVSDEVGWRFVERGELGVA